MDPPRTRRRCGSGSARRPTPRTTQATALSLRAVIEAEHAALDGIRPFDVHAHTGVDVDGTTRTCEEHVADLEAIDARSVIFPLCVTTGYAAENRRVVEGCRCHPDRLVPFARLDPRVASARDAAEALGAGARGFKLHPRAEDFSLDHPGVEAIACVAAEARVPALIHAGVGVGSFGESIVELAERHRECPIVLAHAAVSDLSWLADVAEDHPNLFFDTSWWNPADLLALFALIPPGQILFGSDEPYMDLGAVLAIALRCARFTGLSSEAIALVFGGQLVNLLAGERAIDAGPAPGQPAVALTPSEARVATMLAATGGCIVGGGAPGQLLELTRLAIGENGSGPELAALLDEVEALSEETPWAMAMALTLAVTPSLETAATIG
jgi:predicted TIM-barrel fold metal-dependent hydrolase